MPARDTILDYVGSALAEHLGDGYHLDQLTDVLPDIAEQVWQRWKDREEHGLLGDLQFFAQIGEEKLQELVAEVVGRMAGDSSEALRPLIGLYLTHFPAALRRSQRSVGSAGNDSHPFWVPRKADDVLRLLPTRWPCFQAGYQPFPNCGWYLGHLLGLGTFGEIWHVRDASDGSALLMAMKFITDPSAGDLLRREALLLERVMRQARHPGIVRLLAATLDMGTPFLRYEYVPGCELTALILAAQQPDARWSPHQAARVILSLAEIVGFAHRLDPPLIHRDLKPSNILMRHDGDRPLYAITDYGLGSVMARQTIGSAARGALRGRFLTSAVHGAYSPLYASPQQMRGEPPDPRDDVYALGVIWYQLLTGDATRGRPGGMRWHHRLHARGAPTRLLHLLSECLEEEPDDRPPDAATLTEHLAPILAGKQVLFGTADADYEQRICDILDRANGALLRGDSLGAVWEADSALVLDPHRVPALLVRSEAYHMEGNYQAAIAEALQALQLQPDDPRAYVARARAYFAKGDHDSALADAGEAARIDPRAFDAWCLQAECLWRKKDWSRAVAAAGRAIQLDPKHPQPYTVRGECQRMLGNYREAIADATETLKFQPKNRQAFATRGESYRILSDLDRAVADATEAIRLDAREPLPYATRGEAHRMRGDLGRAMADLNDTLRLNPYDSWSLASRSMVYQGKGDYAAALRDLDEALRLSPKYAAAYAFRGFTYRKMGKFTEAVADLEEALKLNPRYEWAAKELERAQRGDTAY